MRISLKGNTNLQYAKRVSGERHPRWKGGVSTLKERTKLYNQIYRRRIRLAGKLSIQTIQCIYEDNIKYFGTLTCYLCLKPIEFGNDSLEHKTQLSRGGSNEYNNLAIAHKKCNSSKKDKTEKEYREKNVG